MTDMIFWAHPILAILAYVFLILNAVYANALKTDSQRVWYTAVMGWMLVLAGLVSGMLWAQSAWGRYWNWDPKESATLALLITVSATVVSLDQKWSKRTTRILTIVNVALIFTTLLISKLMDSLHAHYS